LETALAAVQRRDELIILPNIPQPNPWCL
jgi:hypothetical protein